MNPPQSFATPSVSREAEWDPHSDTVILDNIFALLGQQATTLDSADSGHVVSQEDVRWILSIEDDDDVAMSLKLRLDKEGFQVIRAAAGMEGYRRAFVEAPRAILLDYELPNGNGAYVMRRLKESAVTSTIPVIVLTGRREAHIERQMRSLGAHEFLTKPLDWPRLLTTIHRL